MVEAPRSAYLSDMTAHGLHDSHEQIYPTGLLEAVVRAQQAGFDAAMCSDHFSRWKERQHFDEASKHVPPEKVAEVVHVSPDLGRHAAWPKAYTNLGFEEIYLHHDGDEQEEFIAAFGGCVLPELS
jgi:hypothetical protein